MATKTRVNNQVRSQSSNTAVFEEIQRLVDATVNGKLDERAKVDQFDGQDKVMLQGINDLIDAFVGPINVTAEYVDRMSKGDIPEEITDEYKGDFNEVKNNLNQCVGVMKGLLAETNVLIAAAQDGKLDERGDADKFPGGWGELVAGINKLIEAVVEPLNEAAKILATMAQKDCTQRVKGNYKGQFAELKDNINNTVIAIDEAMSQVGEAVEQVTAAGGQISASSQSLAEGATEQAAGLEETSSSLEEMASMTKQNAANAEESASASEELSAQAESLQDMVQEFALTNSGSRGSGHRQKIKVDHDAAKKTHELVAKHHGLGQSDQTLHQIASGTDKKAGKKGKAKKAAAKAEAEKAIPLNDDSSNSKDDFKEFNS